MASDMSSRRLRKEFMAIKRDPVENIEAMPLETNILEWHYVITGTKGSPFEGGHYHGKLKFPPEYPLKPPSVLMFTPNGRFATNRRLCLSMSDFHPESWNPMWSVSTILMGLYSFMLDGQPTLGSVSSTPSAKRKFAADSLSHNCKDTTFCKLFPHLVELHESRRRDAVAAAAAAKTSGGSADTGVRTAGGAQANGNKKAAATANEKDSAGNAPAADDAAGGGREDFGTAAIVVCAVAAAVVAILLAQVLM